MKRLIPILVILCLTLTGCSREGSIDELFSLPQLTDEYLDLQHAIDGVLNAGAVHSAPTGGTHRQSVQLFDINGDGVSEALAFFSVNGERPLKICIFTQTENGYEKAAVIEGDGLNIESIDYADMDGDGWREIVVGWGMGSGLKMLNLYSLKGFQVSSIGAADYERYVVADLDGDGHSELMAARQGDDDGSRSVTLFDVTSDGETTTAQTRLSEGMEGITKMSSGILQDSSGALFVEGSCQGGLVTDILTWKNGELKNITLDAETGRSDATWRNSTATYLDLGGSGRPLIPIPRALNAQGETVYRVLDWYGYSSKGRRTIVMTTYHNYSDSWYLTLPDSWGDTITVRREDTDTGERAVVFSLWNGEGKDVTDFLIIYAVTGENRSELAGRDGRLTLLSSSETIYVCKLLLARSEWDKMPDLSYLRENFHLIYAEWSTQ